jgi:hypothetical protein
MPFRSTLSEIRSTDDGALAGDGVEAAGSGAILSGHGWCEARTAPE